MYSPTVPSLYVEVASWDVRVYFSNFQKFLPYESVTFALSIILTTAPFFHNSRLPIADDLGNLQQLWRISRDHRLETSFPSVMCESPMSDFFAV